MVVDGISVHVDLTEASEQEGRGKFPLRRPSSLPDADVFLICSSQYRKGSNHICDTYLPAIRRQMQTPPIMLVETGGNEFISSHMMGLVDIAREEHLAGVATTSAVSSPYDGVEACFEHAVRLGLCHKKTPWYQSMGKRGLFSFFARDRTQRNQGGNQGGLPFYLGGGVPVQDRLFSCSICLEGGLSYKAMVQWSSSCLHRMCRTCTIKYIGSQINDGKLQIECPEVNGGRCKAVLNTATMKRICSEEVLAVYHKNLHSNQHEYVAQLQAGVNSKDAEFIAWAQDNTRNCPRCSVIIYRFAGCDHMSCRCGMSFNWKEASRLRTKQLPVEGEHLVEGEPE
jgi:hypothetical protein